MKRGDIPEKYNAVDILERNLAERGSAVALLSGDRTLTFQQVSEEVNRIGNALLELGVKRNDHVAILCLDSPEWVAAFFGAIKVGAVVASLNTMLTSAEYAYQLNDCQARVLFVHHSLLDKVAEVRGDLPELQHVIVIGGDADTLQALLREQPRTLRAADTLRDDLCCLNYSSGTTGEPKGIHHSHADLPLTAQLVGVNVFGLTAQDRTYAVARLFFTFGTGGNLIFPWYVGASIIVAPESPRDPRTVLKILALHRPTVLFNVPTGYASLLGVEGFPAQYEVSSLRLCVSAGEALPEALWEKWKAATGLELVDGIGTTENYHIFICNRPGQIRPGSSGRPVDGYEVKLLSEEGRLVPAGEVGDLYVRGETAALCYWRKYFASRRAFEGEWLRTGDKYRADADGYYWFAGRADDMLKVGGIWVSPTEVENGLMFHPAVEQCAVVGQRDGSGLTKPMAYVVLRAGYQASPELGRELIDFTTQKMAAYKRPRWLEFVAALPKTATGKIQRYRLRAGAA